MKSIFATTAPVGKGHGGGIVSHYEVMALSETTDLIQILCPNTTYNEYMNTLIVNLNGHYHDNPFMYDYLCSLKVQKADLAFFNGAPFSSTLRAISPTRVIVDVPAHNLELSVEEFEKVVDKYPFRHMTESPMKEWYFDFIVNADVVICPSKLSAEYVKVMPGTKGDIVIIPHGADLPSGPESISENFRVGYLGAVGPDKGLIYLLKAWAGLMYNDSELLLRTDIVDTTLFQKGQKVQFIGKIDNISDFYNQISVYVQPSVTEAFGIPALEAMSHGRPVVVTEGAGVSELVKNGVEGYVVPIRDPESIAERIDFLKTHPGKVEEMGKRARLKAEQYTWERAKQGYKEVLK